MKLVQTSVSSSFRCNSDLLQVAIKTKTSEKKKLATYCNLILLKCDSRAIKIFWVSLLKILKVMNFTLSRILFVSESGKVVLWLMWDVVQVRYCVDGSILC